MQHYILLLSQLPLYWLRLHRCRYQGHQPKGFAVRKFKFHYSLWEKTFLEESFLDNCLPSEENLARDLVRSLRVNFAQIGNYEAVNKAASIEVKLNGRHLFNAAYSRQAYYRNKYKGLTRIRFALRHAQWKAFDLLWGNGESIGRVLGGGLLAIACFAVAIWLNHVDIKFLDAIGSSVSIFWGVKPHREVEPVFVVLLTAIRYLLFGLFMAVLVKRLSRR